MRLSRAGPMKPSAWGYFSAMLTGAPGIQAALIWMLRRSRPCVGRNGNVHLPAIDSGRVTDCPERVHGLSVDRYINGRVDDRQRTRWERLARCKAGAGRPE